MEGIFSSDFEVRNKVAFSGEGDFPYDQLGERDQDGAWLGGNKTVREVFKFQHPAR